jgi:5-carboxymethyl-2-hydroxymuconate isomerase
MQADLARERHADKLSFGWAAMPKPQRTLVISTGQRPKLRFLEVGRVPHIIVEYSANLEEALSIATLVTEVHRAVLATGTFKIGAVRTRAARRDIFVIADGDPQNAFINVIARIGRGRELEKRQGLAAAIMAVIEAQAETLAPSRGLALSVYVEEIDEEGALRKNNLHARMEKAALGNAAE